MLSICKGASGVRQRITVHARRCAKTPLRVFLFADWYVHIYVALLSCTEAGLIKQINLKD